RFSRDWSSDVCSSDLRPLRHPVQGHRRDVRGRRAHEVLAAPPPRASMPKTDVARAHLTKMDDAEVGLVHGSRDPPVETAHVAVDAVPAHLAHEAADLPEARGPIELDRADGVLVTRALGNEPSLDADVELSRQGAEPRS